jgi:hypothetical protein
MSGRPCRRFSRLAVTAMVVGFCGTLQAFVPGEAAGGRAVRAADLQSQAAATVVINELHTDPDVKTERVEFVELYNAGTVPADLSGWQFTAGISYTFGPGTELAAGGYLIVAQDPAAVHAKWSAGRARIPAPSVFGPYTGALSNEGENVALCDAGGALVDEVEYRLGFPWPTVGDAVPEDQPGTGHSMQLVNPAFDNNLGGSWRSALPTPAAPNRVLSARLPPQIRQVNHSPRQPHSGQVVTVTAKVTDAAGVASVTLCYQLVDPGAYVARTDVLYGAWTSVAMHDDGRSGDVRAGDDVYTVELPAALQTHRRLVRYRIAATDAGDDAVLVPYPDDPQPNFAYFVYDGLPAWRGAVQPGVTPVIEFPAEVMGRLPVYHLLAKKTDIENCTWLEKYPIGTSGRKDYRWRGTLVYDGRVYDHIQFRARGGVWRYAMGKNPWKIHFLRGHALQAHDDYGRPYRTTWDTLNLGPCIQQGNFGQRGEHGMFEAVSFRMFRLAGCPAARTNYIHFRIIDEPFEDGTRNAAHPPLTTRGTQYDGDFWGLYLAIEQMDGRFLDEQDLPDGNLYKMDNDVDELNNQGPLQPSDGSDLNQFLGSYRGATEAWWRTNVNLESYYGYYAIYQAIHHGDITEKNWFLYHHPETDQWWQLPWDLDLTWTTYYGANDPSDPFSRAGLLQIPALGIENKNRLREVLDLLFHPEPMGRLIDEYAAVIDDPAGGLSLVDADRAMWDFHWVMDYAAFRQYLSHGPNDDRAGQGRFYVQARQKGYEQSFEGMVKVMKDYVVERISYLKAKCADPAIPNRPTVTAAGPAGFPSNALRFTTTSFSDPQDPGTFGALRWRLAEVTTAPAVGGEPPKYEIDAVWDSGELSVFQSSIRIPATAVEPGRTYRVRCRMKDNTGRWSQWSEPVQFVAGAPIATDLLANLRLTEMMYHPPAPPGSSLNREEYEFVELKNTGAGTLDLSDVSFTQGIAFDFRGHAVTSLGPRQFVLVVRNRQAFLSRYGATLSGVIAGEYEGKLANGGEKITLVDAWDGTVAEFTYGDGRGWPLPADGGGHSLVPLDTALPDEPQGSLNYPGNWRASTCLGGSPGRDDPQPVPTVLLNELMANTSYSSTQNPAQRSNDWIELYNPTGSGVNLGGWYLSDDVAAPKKWPLPAVTIPPHGFLCFDEVTGFGKKFGLSKNGDEVLLSCLPGTAEDRIVDSIRFKAQEAGLSLGRYPDGAAFWFRLQPSAGAANTNPGLDVVIAEVMYHPTDPDLEYVVLRNPLSQAVNLGARDAVWRLDGAVSYLFPTGVSLPANGRVVVVGFDPVTDASRRAAFVAAYAAGAWTPGANLVGPWTGNLSNQGERLALEKSQASDDPDDPVAWVIVDEVIYSNVLPWPQGTDGEGAALQRIYTDQNHSGNDPANWRVVSPSLHGTL